MTTPLRFVDRETVALPLPPILEQVELAGGVYRAMARAAQSAPSRSGVFLCLRRGKGTYEFLGSQASQFRQVGNAVPVLLARQLGVQLAKSLMAARRPARPPRAKSDSASTA